MLRLVSIYTLTDLPQMPLLAQTSDEPVRITERLTASLEILGRCPGHDFFMRDVAVRVCFEVLENQTSLGQFALRQSTPPVMQANQVATLLLVRFRRTASASSNAAAMFRAIALTTGTATELPICRYIWVRDTGILNDFGKPMIALHSDAVSKRIPVSPSRTNVPVNLWILW